MNKEDDNNGSIFSRLRQFLQVEPQNREELINLLRDVHERSLIDAETLSMLESVIQFAQLRVRDIMLPKKHMTSIPENANLRDIIEIITNSGHSRFPVTAAEDPDEVIGILHAKDLLRFQTEENANLDLQDLIRAAIFIPESRRLDHLLREFRQNRNHLAMIVDEYGSVNGFVTIEDVIEQIVGDIEDEFDIEEEAYIKRHANHYYIIKAHTPVEDFNEELHADFSAESYDTIGGLVLSAFGYLPKRGEMITIKDFEFKILHADARRIKLLGCSDQRYLKQPINKPLGSYE